MDQRLASRATPLRPSPVPSARHPPPPCAAHRQQQPAALREAGTGRRPGCLGCSMRRGRRGRHVRGGHERVDVGFVENHRRFDDEHVVLWPVDRGQDVVAFLKQVANNRRQGVGTFFAMHVRARARAMWRGLDGTVACKRCSRGRARRLLRRLLRRLHPLAWRRKDVRLQHAVRYLELRAQPRRLQRGRGTPLPGQAKLDADEQPRAPDVTNKACRVRVLGQRRREDAEALVQVP